MWWSQPVSGHGNSAAVLPPHGGARGAPPSQLGGCGGSRCPHVTAHTQGCARCPLSQRCPLGPPHRNPPQAACAAVGLSIAVRGQALGQRVPFPERDRRGLFTQEGAWRCEKGPVCPAGRYLSPGCAKGLHRDSPCPYQLRTFICLRTARPPSGGAAANTGPRCCPLPGPTAQVSPVLLLLACGSRRRGVTPAAPSRLVTTWGTIAGHGAVFAQRLRPGNRVQARGLSAVLFSTLQGRSEKRDAPLVPTKISAQERGGERGALPVGKHAAQLHRYLSHGHFLPDEHAGLLAPESRSAAGLCGSAGAW